MDQELTTLLAQQGDGIAAIAIDQRRHADTLTIISRTLADNLMLAAG